MNAAKLGAPSVRDAGVQGGQFWPSPGIGGRRAPARPAVLGEQGLPAGGGLRGPGQEP